MPNLPATKRPARPSRAAFRRLLPLLWLLPVAFIAFLLWNAADLAEQASTAGYPGVYPAADFKRVEDIKDESWRPYSIELHDQFVASSKRNSRSSLYLAVLLALALPVVKWSVIPAWRRTPAEHRPTWRLRVPVVVVTAFIAAVLLCYGSFGIAGILLLLALTLPVGLGFGPGWNKVGRWWEARENRRNAAAAAQAAAAAARAANPHNRDAKLTTSDGKDITRANAEFRLYAGFGAIFGMVVCAGLGFLVPSLLAFVLAFFLMFAAVALMASGGGDLARIERHQVKLDRAANDQLEAEKELERQTAHGTAKVDRGLVLAAPDTPGTEHNGFTIDIPAPRGDAP